jgi:DNA replication protein DnaC
MSDAMSSACPHQRCDGSGFVYDEERRTARPCSCRPARIARKRAAALEARIPRRFREVGFDREPVLSIERENPVVVGEVRRYVRAIDERLDAGRGIWFSGDVGTGKTTLAMLISKAAIEADRTVAIYSLPRLLNVLRETYDDDAQLSLQEFIDRLCSVDLLHIDDVGAEQSSSWVLEQLYTIVNARYEDGRAIVLTTNLVDAKGDEALREQLGSRTVSRIHEICGGLPLMMSGRDRRLEASWSIPAPTAPAPASPAYDAPAAGGFAWDDELPAYGEAPRRRRLAS